MQEPNRQCSQTAPSPLHSDSLWQLERTADGTYFDVIDDFRHPQCMMVCSWWPKRNPCSLFRTKKRSNSFARIHLFGKAALQNCTICSQCVTVKHVIRSHFICCMVNTWPGLLEPPEHGKIRHSSGPKTLKTAGIGSSMT